MEFDDLKFCPEISNDACNFDSVHVGEAVDVTALFLDVEERSTSQDVGVNAIVHLTPAEALKLACYMMDWAMEHIDLPTIGDFGVDEFEIEDAFDPFEEEVFDFDIRSRLSAQPGEENPYEDDQQDFSPSPYAINQSGYPVKTVPLKFTPADDCDCEMCREWRMTH